MTSTRKPVVAAGRRSGAASLYSPFTFRFTASIFLLLVLISLNGKAQVHSGNGESGNAGPYPSTLGLHFLLYDFQSAPTFKNQYTMDKGLGVDFVKGSPHRLTWEAGLNGLFTYKAQKTGPDYPNRKFMAEGVFAGRFRLLGNRAAFIQPFLNAGAGLSYYASGFNVFVPAGAGLEIKTFNKGFMVLKAQYRLSLMNQFTSNYFYSAGVSGTLGGNKSHKKQTPAIVPPEESLAAAKVYDRDKDGIPDSTDACPDLAGIAKYKGCPIPDTDGDGINDEEDACPTVPGLAAYKGCPAPAPAIDSAAVKDSIRTEMAKKEAQHLQKIKPSILKLVEKAAHNLFFVSGSYQISPMSAQALDTLVAIFRSYPSLKLKIEGYSDNKGNPAKNKQLSQQRAEAVKQYFVSKGIDASRIEAIGYGQEKPIASNNTEKGRALNRRVEMKMIPQ